MIEIKHLSKNYNSLKAVDNVSFEVKKGEILGLLGPNGAGKTTIMRILTCYLPATSGTAKIAGFDVFENSMDVRKKIGYMPENPPLYNEMTVKSYLNFVAEIKEVQSKKRKERINKVIEMTSIDKISHRLIGNISKGYKQRVGLAQALIHDPEVLILDEPTVGLDPRQIIEIRNLIKNLAGKKTIILSTHILPEASSICQRVVIINEGKIVAIDSHEELSKRLGGGDILLAEIKGPLEEVKEKIRKIQGVKDLIIKSKMNEKNKFEIQCGKNIDIREDLFKVMALNNWPILELRPCGMSLEDIFLKLTTKEEEV